MKLKHESNIHQTTVGKLDSSRNQRRRKQDVEVPAEVYRAKGADTCEYVGCGNIFNP